MRTIHNARLALTAAAASLCAGCASPLDSDWRPALADNGDAPPSAARTNTTNPPPALRPTDLGEDPTLDDYLAYAELNNAGLEAARQRWIAAKEGAARADTPPDPMLSYSPMFSTRGSAQEHQFMVSQTLPWFGTLGLRAQAAERAAESARMEFESARLALHYRVRSAYYELYYLARSIELTRETLSILEQVEAAARSRLRAGTGEHADVVRAQVEIAREEDRLRELEQMREPLASRLNAALNRPVDMTVILPHEIPHDRYDGDIGAIVSILEETNPDLAARRERVEAERARTDEARRAFFPDVTLGVGYAIRSGSNRMGMEMEDAVMAMIGVSIPLWRESYQAGVRQRIATRLAAANAERETRYSLSSDAQAALFAHTDADRRARLYETTLIPKATEALEASLGALRAGRAGLTDVLDAQRTLIEFGVSMERAKVDRAAALAELEMLVGKRLTKDSADADPENER